MIAYILQYLLLLAIRATEVEYTAAVTEYQPYGNPLNYQQTLRRNIEIIEDYVKDAKQQDADIVVFPEYALFPYTIFKTRKQLQRLLQEVCPKEYLIPWHPCNSSSTGKDTEYIRKLSCIAQRHKIYMVVNLGEIEYCDRSKDPKCPVENGYFYNTNVAFDRHGSLVARYRKANLYKELYDTPLKEAVYFDTDFGVRFGMIICFDILWENPYIHLVEGLGIRDIIFSTAWFDQLPFKLAPQVQSENAYLWDINLLAAQNYFPTIGGMGYGIYQGKSKHYNYNYSTVNKTSMIVQKVRTRRIGWNDLSDSMQSVPTRSMHHDNTSLVVPSTWDDELQRLTPGSSGLHNIKSMNMSNYRGITLTSGHTSISMGNTICEATYDVTSFDGFPGVYKLVVTDGMHLSGGKYYFNQVCAVLYCLRDESVLDSCSHRDSTVVDTNTFRKLSMTGIFDKPEYVAPSVVRTDLSLSFDWTASKTEHLNLVTLEISSPINNLQVFSLFGRNYNKDAV